MGDTSKMDRAAMQEALALVVKAQDECRHEWRSWSATLPKRLNAAQRERSAYLRGRLAGLHQAHRFFEAKAPLELYGSSDEQ